MPIDVYVPGCPPPPECEDQDGDGYGEGAGCIAAAHVSHHHPKVELLHIADPAQPPMKLEKIKRTGKAPGHDA